MENYEITKLLLQLGADPNAGNPILDIKHNDEGAYSLIKLLLEFGANPNVVDNYNSNLPLVTYINNIPVRNLLLQHHADINFIDENNNTVLMRVIWKYNDVKPVNFLFNNDNGDVDPNSVNLQGKTALMLAVDNGRDYSVVETLLIHGSNPNIIDDEGNSALSIVKNYMEDIFWYSQNQSNIDMTLRVLTLYGATL